jgi:hypothetical protein
VQGRVSIATWARHQTALVVLQHVVETLAVAGIRVLPVKGVVTSRILYEDPGERPMQDIDVRLALPDLRLALEVARARGWTSHRESPRLHEVVFEVDHWQIDVECTLGPPGLCATTVAQILRRASRVTTPFAHLEPDLHDHALLLVLNAFKDGLRPTPWGLEDLRRIGRHAGLDPCRLVERAREGKVLSVLWIVADWLSEQEGAVEWRAAREMVGPRPPSRRVASVYAYLVGRGWRPRPGVLAAASSSDSLVQSAAGLVLAAAGIVRRRALILERRYRNHALPHSS